MMKINLPMLPDFSRCHVVVVGDVMLDVYFMGQVRRISPEAPVPVVHVREKTNTLGGAGNTSLNLAGLKCKTTLVGVCGADDSGTRLRQIVAAKKITDQIVEIADHPTTTKTRVIGQGQQLVRLDEENLLTPSKVVHDQLFTRIQKIINTADAVILSDYGKGVLYNDFNQKIIDQCKKSKIPVIIDPKGKNWKPYRGATCITPNTAEVELAAGLEANSAENTLINAATRLCKSHKLDRLLLTRGAKGMCLIEPENQPTPIPATAKEVYDVSGAGDTVIATLAACIASGMEFSAAAVIANIAAGIVVGKLGSQAIHLPELNAALKRHMSGGDNSGGKNVTLDAARIQVKAWQAGGEKVVFTNGCFDLLHPGHIHILNQSREAGDRLVVGLNTDASIKSIKGPSRPIVSEQDRADVLAALGCVDLVILFDEDTPLNLIKSLKPDVLAKGADYTIDQVVGYDVVQSYGGQVHLIPLLEGHSTTKIVNRLNGSPNDRK
jgi:D-beta-D-heptose 7-phosphate kinase / D-beta-D-heptose 1-phosphate adenosyltransferase